MNPPLGRPRKVNVVGRTRQVAARNLIHHCCLLLLCYVVLCCAVLCCVVLCCVVLCCVVLCCAVLCCVHRIKEVDGGGEPGYDHCYCRVGPGAAYDPAAGEVEIARYVLSLLRVSRLVANVRWAVPFLLSILLDIVIAVLYDFVGYRQRLSE